MSKKKIIIISLIVISILGIGLVIFNSVRVSKNNEIVMNDIREGYNKLEKDIKSYNDVRSNLVNTVNSYYSSEMNEYYDKFVNILNSEKKLLGDIEKKVNKLDKLCLDRLFKKSEVNNMCGKYKVYYETLNNIYINDINDVNNIIVNYNNEYNGELVEFSSDREYVDYNEDGIFLEREDK